mgnify:CR=1 FL=1
MALTTEWKRRARDDLKRLYGRPPHNDPGNLCRNDAYFARSLVFKYGTSLSELEKAVEPKSRLRGESK